MQPCAAYYRSIDSPDCIASESEAELSSSWWRCVDAARSRGERKKGKKEKERKEKKKGRKKRGEKKERALGVEYGACDDIYFFLSIFSPRSSVPPFAGQANGPVPAHTIHPTLIPCISLLIHVCTRRELLRVEIGRRAR